MNLKPEAHVKAEPKETVQIVRRSVCPECTRIAGEQVMRSPDRKGVHKCQICRSEMTEEYAAKLPRLKAAKAASLKD